MINEKVVPNNEQIKEVIKQEYIKCVNNPIYFMKRYCMIQHPTKGRMMFNLFDFQEDVLKDFQNNRHNIILKSRQLGISTVAAGFAMWEMNFFDDKNILIIATKQDVAKNLVHKVRFMYQNLPSWLKTGFVEDNKLSLKLKNGSQIKAIASSEDAGRSEALSRLIIDECQHFNTLITVKDKITGEIKNIKIGDLYNEL